jgi:hypothetical protein
MVQWFKELMRTIEDMTPLEKAFHLANAMRAACGGVWVNPGRRRSFQYRMHEKYVKWNIAGR